MSKVQTPTLVNPFTRPGLTDAERLEIAAITAPLVPPGREVTMNSLPSAPKVTKDDHKDAAKAIDNKIRAQVSKAVLAATRWADDNDGDMDVQEKNIKHCAQLSDKEAPIGLKVALKVYESFQKKQESEERPHLAIQINFGGQRIAYPERVLEDES